MDSTTRTSRWAFTAYEDQYALLDSIPDLIAEWGWQDEVCPDTGRKHRQGFIRTHSQQRFSALKKVLPGIHIEPAKNWLALVSYCKKEETRDVSGTQVHQVNERKYMTLDVALDRIASVWDDQSFSFSMTLRPSKIGDYTKMVEPLTYEQALKKEFDKAICKLVTEHPADIGYYVRPDVWRAWTMTHSVWLTRRQTDTVTQVRFISHDEVEPTSIEDASSSPSPR